MNKKDVTARTYRIDNITIRTIESFAADRNVSNSKALHTLIDLGTRYLYEKQLDKELEDLSKNKKWLSYNQTWADMDLL